MPIVGMCRAAGDARGHRRRHALEHEREAPGLLEGQRVLEQLPRLLGRAALGLEAAEHRRRLRRQPDVAHHGNARADERPYPREHRPRALDLHRVRAGFLDEAHGVLHGRLVRDLEGAERHVRDDERPPRAARHRPRQHDHLVHRRRHGRGVAEHRHRRRVAHEHDVHAGLVGQPAARRVVRGHHHDPLAALLHLRQLGQGQLARSGRGWCGLTRPGAHEPPPVGRCR